MSWIFAVIYIVVAIVLLFLFEKIFPYNEDITLGYSDSEQRRMYKSYIAFGVAFWPMLLIAYAIMWTINFVGGLIDRR